MLTVIRRPLILTLQRQVFQIVKVWRLMVSNPGFGVAHHAAIPLLVWYTDALHVKTEPIVAAQE
jgi:elongation factor P--beta-lysine ligase